MKIEKAKTLIRETPMNFTEISEFLGFSSVHHFFQKIQTVSKNVSFRISAFYQVALQKNKGDTSINLPVSPSFLFTTIKFRTK